MDQYLAGIDRRKEIAAEERHQQERQSDETEEGQDEYLAVPERHVQQVVIGVAELLEPGLEPALERNQRIAGRRLLALFMMHVLVQQVLRHRRHQRARQDERPDHREHHRFRHRHEQEARHAGQEEHRHEHDADTQQRDEGRRYDLARAVENGLLDLLALLKMPVDVFDGDRRVVDQNADRQCEAAERHDVERLADRGETDDRAQHRQRDRDRDNNGRAPASQEQQDHDAGQRRRQHTFEGDARDRTAHEDRLVAEQIDAQRLRQLILGVDDLLLDAGDDIERRCRACLQHHHQNGPGAVDMDDVGLRRIAVADLGHVADVDRCTVDDLDRQVAEVFEFARRVVELDVVFEVANLLRADRRNQVLRSERIGDVLSRQAECLHRVRIDVELDLALLAAERPRDRRAGHRDERRAQLVGGDVEHVLFGQPLAAQCELNDRHGRGAVVQDQRRRRTCGQLPEHGLRNGRDLRVRCADVDIRLKEDLDDAVGIVRVGDDVLDVIDRRGQRALERRDDTARHLIRRQAGVLPHHTDDRDADLGENIGRSTQSRERPDNQEQEREHDESIRSAQGNPDKRIHRLCFSVGGRSAAPAGKRPVFFTL